VSRNARAVAQRRREFRLESWRTRNARAVAQRRREFGLEAWKRAAIVATCAAIGASAIACSQTNTIAYEVPDAGSDVPVETNPYGAACPTQHLGHKPRASLAASQPGDVIPNLVFQGYVGGDSSKGLQTVKLCDYFDPQTLKYKVLHLSVGALWCGPCNAESETVVQIVPKWAAQKLTFMEAIDEGASPNKPSTLADLDLWVEHHQSNYTTVLDPGPTELAGFFDKTVLPWNADIDARSMEILQASSGFTGQSELEGTMQAALDWVNANPPSYTGQ
jgi:hypothetical protein